MSVGQQKPIRRKEIQIDTPKTLITGDLYIPDNYKGIIIFAHGAGSSRHSPRNQHVADILHNTGFATLLMDLLSEEEDRLDISGKLRFDVPLLAGRVDSAAEWVLNNEKFSGLPMGYFGASTGAAAALLAATQKPENVQAIVSRGGRPDLAENVLSEVTAPTLLLVGSEDRIVLEKNKAAFKKLKHAEKKLIIIQGAAHLFTEPGKLNEVADRAAEWFNEKMF